MSENYNGYTLNVEGDEEPNGTIENTLFKAILDLLPDSGSTLVTTRHTHDRLHDAADTLRLQVGNSELVVNEANASYDFRVEGTGGNLTTHTLFVDGSEAYVGIGCSAPQAPLHIQNPVSESSNVSMPTLSDAPLMILARDGDVVFDLISSNNYVYRINFGTDSDENQSSIVVTNANAAEEMQLKVNLLTSIYLYGYNTGEARIKMHQSVSDAAIPVLVLEQDDNDVEIAALKGYSAADDTTNISTQDGDGSVVGPKAPNVQAGWAFSRMVKCALIDQNSGAQTGAFWIAGYTPSSP